MAPLMVLARGSPIAWAWSHFVMVLVLLDDRCSVADAADDGGRGRSHEDRVEDPAGT